VAPAPGETGREQNPRIFHGSEPRVCVTFCAILLIDFLERPKGPINIWFLVDAQGIEPWTSPV